MKAIFRMLISRILGLLRRRRFEREMAEEIRAHLEVLVEGNIAAGMSPLEARAAAQRQFGGPEQIKEQCRDGRGLIWLEQIAKDIALTARSLARARGYTITVVTLLGAGIFVAAVVFQLTSWILIWALPYPNADQLFMIGTKDRQGGSSPYRPAVFLPAYREQLSVFSEYAAVTREEANAVVEQEPAVVQLVNTSHDCFKTLGIQPALGRSFLPEEYVAGADNVVIVTDLFWRRHFGVAPDVLGKTLLVNQQPCTVVGVLRVTQPFPPAFQGDVFRPLVLTIDPAAPLSPAAFIIGRLKSGMTPEQAEAAMDAVTLPELPAWAAAWVGDNPSVLIRPASLYRPETYWVMAVAAFLLYAIACLNSSNLMLVRLLGRHREFGIRLALGGSRLRMARLLVIESAALGLMAMLLVLIAARWFSPLLAVLTTNEAVRYNPHWTWPVVSFIAGGGLFASILVAVVPLWRVSRAELNNVMKDGGAAVGETLRTGRLRLSLVILQAALAVVLLAGTGLLLRSFERLHRSKLGFDPTGRVKVRIAFPRDYPRAPESRLQLFETLSQRLAALPGVKAASFGQDSLLIGGYGAAAQLLMEDGSYQPVAGNFVAADYAQVAGLVLNKGRWFSGRRGEFEVVINEALAKARFGEEDPIGRSFRLLVSGEFENPIVGVVADVKDTVRAAAGMRFYVPDWAYPLNIDTLVLQLHQNPGSEFAGLVRRTIYDVDPLLITSQVNAINEIVSGSMWAEHFAFRILRGLALIALVLSVAGLFSVVMFTVNCRMREFGVRSALGAQPADLRRLVMRRGLITAGAGLALGVAGALALTRFMQSMLFETTPYDPLVYLGVSVFMLLAAALACWLPARRAARVDVVRLLRME